MCKISYDGAIDMRREAGQRRPIMTAKTGDRKISYAII